MLPMKLGLVNPHIQVKWVTFLGVKWVTGSNHRKLDNLVYIFKNGDYGFRAFVNIRLSQVDILISKNQALQILYFKHHDNVYKTP